MKTLFCFCVSIIAGLPCWSQSFVNPSLEAWAAPGVCETNTPPDGWTDYSNVGIGPDEGTLTLCPSTIPPNAANGNTYARCLAGNPTTGEGMYQNVSGFVLGNSYTISYQFCGSNLWGGNGDCVWHLFIDDVDVNQSAVFSSGSPVWQTNYYTFTATMPTHKIGLRAYTPTFNGGGSAAIDNFMITESKPTGIDDFVAEEISVFPSPARNEFTIYNLRNTIVKVKIFDMQGRQIFNRQLKCEPSLVIDIRMWNPGIYVVEVRDEKNNYIKKKLMKV